MKEYIKTIVNGLKIYIKNSRGDWNQNDETAPNYIKNRTHWVEKNPEIILFEEYGVLRELSNE